MRAYQEFSGGQSFPHSLTDNWIQALVEDCLHRRAAGEVVSDQSLIDSPPELGQELKKLQLIGKAKMAADVDTDR